MTNENKFSSPKYKKGLVLITIITVCLIYRLSTDEETIKDICFYDKVLLEYTNDITLYLSQHLYLNDFLIVASSGCLDILMICFIFHFINYCRSWLPIISLSMFYGFRAVLQKVFVFSFYDNYLAHNPGFFSIVVPYSYLRTADFFYSGHCGCAFILSLHFYYEKEIFLFYYGLFVTFIEACVMLVTRSHYSIDILYGIIFGHYFYIISSKLCNYINQNKEPQHKTKSLIEMYRLDL
jgi:hypothetical protein